MLHKSDESLGRKKILLINNLGLKYSYEPFLKHLANFTAMERIEMRCQKHIVK